MSGARPDVEEGGEACALDRAVLAGLAELERRRFRAPEVLVFCSTGVGMLPARLEGAERLPFGRIAGAPAPWKDVLLYAGMLGPLAVWLADDAPAAAASQHGKPRVHAAPRSALAPCSGGPGARVVIDVSAGVALPAPARRALVPGSIAVASDHLNLSGTTPLVGLGASKLGPLFPDTSQLHHAALREAALRHAKELGIAARAAVVACTVGPALETPAERAFWAKAGAAVAVQGLADPLLASAHAGLACLALVAVTDAGDEPGDLGQLVAAADRLAPALEDLIVALVPDLRRAADELGVEEGARPARSRSSSPAAGAASRTSPRRSRAASSTRGSGSSSRARRRPSRSSARAASA